VPSLYDSAALFFERVLEIKAGLNVPFEWYPYNTLANAEHLERLLANSSLVLENLVKGRLVLDVGCGDGEWSFFLESLGAQVHAVDCPITNHNAMAGVRTLKEALGSRLEICPADLDGRFTFPSKEYGVAFFFGTLYHLKNPFYVLETLARVSRYCFLSTRIARTFHPRLGETPDLPLAYLLGSDELNADDSNFWIFSKAGLERLLRRTHWNVASRYSVCASEESNPWSLDGDERMFCLVESTYGLPGVEFVDGWHAPEESGWRWTGRRFSARLEPPRSATGTLVLRLDMYVPEAISLPLRLSASIDGRALAAEVMEHPGFHSLLRAVPGLANGSPRSVEFSLDQAIEPDDADGRERGVIVSAIRLERR
jgi:SAM-dependent methyltransferase